MKFPLPLLLLLPLHAAFAQMRPTYSAPRPGYTPAPLYHPTTTPYQSQQQTQQQAHQNFQRMQSQQVQQMQQQYYYNNVQRALTRQQVAVLRRPMSPEQLAKTQATQQQAEQKAAAQLTQLTQEQQRRRQANPAPDAQLAAAQQQADAKQLAVLTVKTYREAYLPGQMLSALQSLALPAKTQQELQALNHDLLDNGWWSKEAAQAPAKVAAYGNTLATLTTNLLGFELASPPPAPAPLATSALNEMLAKDSFDRLAAAQLIQTATQAEKRLAGARLALAVKDFQELGAKVAAIQEPQPDLKQQRNEVKKSLQRVNRELARYNAQVGNSGSLAQVQKAILKSTSDYLAKNGS
ncbi:MAG: hypothetical protein ACRYFZ_26200 [Janthinobacterium lividum]